MTKTRTVLLAAGCTAAGALGAGGVGALANGGGVHHRGGFHHFGMFGGAVHSEAVVPKGDDDFTTVVYDRGKITDIDGRTLTVAIGTHDETWKTDTFDVPDGAKIARWGERHASFSDLEVGDKVTIVRSATKYVVLAAPGRK